MNASLVAHASNCGAPCPINPASLRGASTLGETIPPIG
jgi:hypothetical protein